MQDRVLGGTGVKISSHAPGALILGASIDDTGPEDCARIVHEALDAGATSSTRRRLPGRRVRGRRRPGDRGPAGRGGPATESGRAMAGTPTARAPRRWVRRAVEDLLRRRQRLPGRVQPPPPALADRPDPAVRHHLRPRAAACLSSLALPSPSPPGEQRRNSGRTGDPAHASPLHQVDKASVEVDGDPGRGGLLDAGLEDAAALASLENLSV